MARLVVVAGVCAALLPSAAQAAAPNYIFVNGPGLGRPVLLGDWNENLELFSAAVSARSPSAPTLRRLRDRPSLDLALFWGWSGKPAPTTRRGQPAWPVLSRPRL